MQGVSGWGDDPLFLAHPEQEELGKRGLDKKWTPLKGKRELVARLQVFLWFLFSAVLFRNQKTSNHLPPPDAADWLRLWTASLSLPAFENCTGVPLDPCGSTCSMQWSQLRSQQWSHQRSSRRSSQCSSVGGTMLEKQ